MADIVEPVKRITDLLDAAEPRLARSFAAAIQQLRDSLDLTEVADLLQAGRYEDLLNYLRDVAAELAQAVNVVFADAGRSTAEFLRSMDLGRIAFDLVNVRAVAMMQDNQLRLIREFTDDQRNVLREVMTAGVTRGANPVEQARQFREVVGLTQRQARAVINYRRLLERAGRSEFSVADQRESLTRALRDGRGDRAVEAAIRAARPLPQKRIDWLVERYRARSIKYRAEVIGRTEALRAVHQGSEAMYAQAVQEGRINPEAIREQWNSAHDRRVRDSHRMLDGKPKNPDGYWQGLTGRLRYPGDPLAPGSETIQCRCVVTRTIRRQTLADQIGAGIADIIGRG